ncbi:MAG TPA: membrane-bound PQQ-dependent dehydrogenase, glucose/quinate/shikimate family, partial [Candidatus Binatia bacterium]|nr:membrane-bound PQQ-dependent dehydrogenase, glucose/quinate/shikimate family [Candidatus Binatia bacterium]
MPATPPSSPAGLPRSRLIAQVTGFVYAVLGLALAGGGVWLIVLGGSWFYLLAGIGVLASGILLIAGRREALWVFAIVLIGTLIWAVTEVGFDWWPLAARGDVIFPLGLWLLTPWVRRGLDRGGSRAMTFPLWIGAIASVVVLVIALFTDTHDIGGTIEAASASPAQEPGDQPDEDWRAYGRTQAGLRYSPLKEITPENANQLKVAWTFRTGDLPGKNDPGETTFEVTPIKVRDTLYLCSQHQRLFALDAATGSLKWSYDPKVQD